MCIGLGDPSHEASNGAQVVCAVEASVWFVECSRCSG